MAPNSCFKSEYLRMYERNADSVINAKILANHFRKLCTEFSPPYREANTSGNRRKLSSNNNVIRFLSRTEGLIKEEKVNGDIFINEIKHATEKGFLHIEILWFLHVLRLLPLTELISHYEDKNEEKVIEQISNEICENFWNCNTSPSKLRKEMVLDFIIAVFERSKKGSKISIYSKVLNFIAFSLKQFYKNEESCSERSLDLPVLINLFDCTKLNQTILQTFLQEILIIVLEGSAHTVKFIIKKQEKMKSNVKGHKIFNFFIITSKYFDLSDMVAIIQRVSLDVSKFIDWDFMLCFITFVGIHFKDGWNSLKTLSNFLLKTSFKTFDMKILSSAIFIVRQGCFEKGNNSFPSYLQWFSSSFSSKTKLINNEKICKFFFSFLTDILPYESPYYLKVHINRPPWVPLDCHWVLENYISLVKAQLNDLNVSTELGICENMTKKSATVFDVENVMKHFERTNEILNSVFQASLFCKDYYEKKFLVELLSKFEGKNSNRHKLISKLHSLGKIPNSLFKSYKSLEKKYK